MKSSIKHICFLSMDSQQNSKFSLVYRFMQTFFVLNKMFMKQTSVFFLLHMFFVFIKKKSKKKFSFKDFIFFALKSGLDLEN